MNNLGKYYKKVQDVMRQIANRDYPDYKITIYPSRRWTLHLSFRRNPQVPELFPPNSPAADTEHDYQHRDRA